jgi:hypothetical protein
MWKPAPPPAGGGGGNAGPWVVRGISSPMFPNTSMFTVSAGFTNVTYENEPNGRGIIFIRINNSGGNGWSLRLKTVSLPVRVICGFSDIGTRRHQRGGGLIVYNTANGRFFLCGFESNNNVLFQKWNSTTSFGGNSFTENNSRFTEYLVGLELTSTSFTAFFYCTRDYRFSVFTEPYSSFLGTPTHIGIGVRNESSTDPSVLWFWHWEEVAL